MGGVGVGRVGFKMMVMKNWCCLELAKVVTTSVARHPGFGNEIHLVWGTAI